MLHGNIAMHNERREEKYNYIQMISVRLWSIRCPSFLVSNLSFPGRQRVGQHQVLAAVSDSGWPAVNASTTERTIFKGGESISKRGRKAGAVEATKL